MRKFLTELLLAAATASALSCTGVQDRPDFALDPEFARQVVESGFIHSPLPLDYSRSNETAGLRKEVLEEEPLLTTGDDWSLRGIGSYEFTAGENPQGYRVRMTATPFTGRRAKGSPDDPDYATYGNCSLVCNLHGRDFSGFNRIRFRIRPDCPGARVVNLNLSFAGSEPHLINLVPGEWNECYLDLDGLRTDRVREFSFSVSLKGLDMTAVNRLDYELGDFRMQRVERTKKSAGWEPEEGVIIYSGSGYASDSPKTAIASAASVGNGQSFKVREAGSGRTAFRGKAERKSTGTGEYAVLDFSSLSREGLYILSCGGIETRPFRIGKGIWTDAQWKALNFLFCQRCGYPVPGKHGICHHDLLSVHNGESISFCGGWHDAGDLSQQCLQTGDIAYSLLEAYEACKDSNPALAARLLEEARWGLEFCLRNRYGDGYRASSVGLLIWQDGRFGSIDDIHTVRVHNLAYDNFLFSAYEAGAAMSIPDDDALADYLGRVAEEDFRFAMEKFSRDGFDKFIYQYEHTYNTSHSQYMATVSWAASQLYRLTGKQEYAKTAAEAAEYVLGCQQTEPLADGTCGFFYRDTDRTTPVHYIHQSREQLYMQALTLLCRTQAGHPDCARWMESIRLYGSYLKSLMKYTAPYGMVPSGVYADGEPLDRESFEALHIFAPADAAARFSTQVRKGVKIDEGYYVRRFPVWFNIFSGNSAVMLATGKAAALAGKALSDAALLDIAREQLYWQAGKNPFGESLMFGEAYNYPQMNSFSSGEMTGEMPVGIKSLGDEDIPAWPQINNACYKEVWVSTAGKFLSLISEF